MEREIAMSTMKLPANYATINEEEMVYLDGGASFYDNFLNVGKVFNSINNFNVIYTAFVTLNQLLKGFAKN